MARTLNKRPGGDLSRLRRFAQNHLGVIMTDDLGQTKIVRNDHLDLLDKYYENEQYDDLQDWDDACQQEDYVPIRKRKPRIIYNVAKVLVEKVTSKLVGTSTFPTFLVEDDDEDTDFFRTVMKACQFKRSMLDVIKNMLKSGAVFARYYLVNGVCKIEYAKAKYCYPVFDVAGQLDSIDIKYVYEDQNDRNAQGSPKQKWYRIALTKTADIMFDSPEYRPGLRPTFNEIARNEHQLGWVQGEWFVTHCDKFDYDGYSLYGDILGFIDELNYSLSQASQAISYNQEPQLAVNGVDEEELERLIRSSQKAWNLGREGKAEYLNSDMNGPKIASEEREKMRNFMLDVVRVVLHDPEQIKGQAQSGEALKQLYGPLLELVDELRTVIEPTLVQLLIKISLTMLHYNAQGLDTAIETPPGYIPSSFDLTVQWPPIFPATIQDIQLMAQAAGLLDQHQIISKETLTKWIAQVIPSVENVEEELKKIAAQPPPPSPFGSFGGNE